ncbi:hypothetical protein ACFU5O_18060 [Streptomyces sp. NPDC057445]|uniref:hypothetical protein n=1 Tax=Streptomyces sp. NPDC057445 TaxID=3346136 RepID=UPI00369A152E
MSHALPRRRPWLGRTAVLAMSVGILTGGIPVLDNVQDAEAATKRCSEMYGTPNRAPRLGSLPGFKAPGPYQWRTRGDTKRTYDYDNPRRALSGLELPDAATLAKIKPDPKLYDNATPEHAWAYWKQNQAKGDNRYKGTFNDYVNTLYSNGEGNSRRGNAYERENAEYFKLGGRDWYCQYSLAEEMPELYAEIVQELIDELGEQKAKEVLKEDRRFDAIRNSGRQKIIYEFKSGREIGRAQLLIDQKMAARGYKVVYIFGRQPTRNTMDLLKQHGVSWYQHRAVENGRFTPNEHTRKDTAFTDPKNGRSSRGAANDMARDSGRTEEEARRRAQARAKAPGAVNRVRGPGGIDFSTMELRYITEPVKGKGMDYGFKARLNDDEDNNPSWGGGEKIDLASDSMFTWLALHPNRFWVNLNPDQPDQVTDDKLAKTDAGHVLLEADLQMKHDLAKVMVPDNPVGSRLWDSFRHVNGAPCWKTYRFFIEPAPAQVREEDGKLYILDAPMDVKAEKLEIKNPPRCDQPEEVQEYNFRQIRQIAIPEVEKFVNNDPQYADLRRVYTSRIAAEWIKQRDAVKPGDFHSIIGSDDASAWPARTKWDRNKVYADYMKSYREGDFHFKRKYEQDGTVLEFEFATGGVDFSKQPKRNISKVRFQAEHPELPDTAQQSTKSTVQYGDTDTGYLGGNNYGKAPGGDGDDPTPTPPGDPDPTPTPTQQPPTPAPTDSTPGGHEPTHGPQDPGGDLAHTGSSGVGRMVTLAAGLVAVGGGLAWWMRRRKAAHL